MPQIPKTGAKRYVVIGAMIVLGLAFIAAGASKLLGPEAAQANFENWGYPGWFALVIGAVELMAGLAVLWYRLTPYAAAVLVGDMIGATITHMVAAEWAMIGVTLVLGALAGFVAWMTRPDYVDEHLHMPHFGHAGH